jgi:hypothetical protein
MVSYKIIRGIVSIHFTGLVVSAQGITGLVTSAQGVAGLDST